MSEGCPSLHEAGVCIRRNFQTEREEAGGFCCGRGWDGLDLQGPRGSGQWEGMEAPLGARLAEEFAAELSACTGLPSRGSEAQTKLRTSSRRRGPRGGDRVAPSSPPRYSDAPPPPGRHTPPQTHVLPGPPLVTLVLTYINPISHTRTDWLGTHPGTPGQRRPPKRPFLSLMPLSQRLEQGGDPGRSVNTRSASPKATISHNNIPTSPHCRPVPSGHTRTT